MTYNCFELYSSLKKREIYNIFLKNCLKVYIFPLKSLYLKYVFKVHESIVIRRSKLFLN